MTSSFLNINFRYVIYILIIVCVIFTLLNICNTDTEDFVSTVDQKTKICPVIINPAKYGKFLGNNILVSPEIKVPDILGSPITQSCYNLAYADSNCKKIPPIKSDDYLKNNSYLSSLLANKIICNAQNYKYINLNNGNISNTLNLGNSIYHNDFKKGTFQINVKNVTNFNICLQKKINNITTDLLVLPFLNNIGLDDYHFNEGTIFGNHMNPPVNPQINFNLNEYLTVILDKSQNGTSGKGFTIHFNATDKDGNILSNSSNIKRSLSYRYEGQHDNIGLAISTTFPIDNSSITILNNS